VLPFRVIRKYGRLLRLLVHRRHEVSKRTFLVSFLLSGNGRQIILKMLHQYNKYHLK